MNATTRSCVSARSRGVASGDIPEHWRTRGYCRWFVEQCRRRGSRNSRQDEAGDPSLNRPLRGVVPDVLSDRRVRAPVGRIRAGGVRDLRQARTV